MGSQGRALLHLNTCNSTQYSAANSFLSKYCFSGDKFDKSELSTKLNCRRNIFRGVDECGAESEILLSCRMVNSGMGYNWERERERRMEDGGGISPPTLKRAFVRSIKNVGRAILLTERKHKLLF